MAEINVKRTVLMLDPDGVGSPVAVETTEPILIAPEFASVDVSRITGQMNSQDTIIDTCAAKAEFDVPHMMLTNNIAGDNLTAKPTFGTILEAAGFTAKVTGSVLTYANSTATQPQNTAAVYVDDQKFSFTKSLAGSFAMKLETGQVALLTGEYSGYIDDPVPVSETNPTVATSLEVPLLVSCADIMLFDGDSLPLTNVEIKMNPVIADIYTIGGTNGLKKSIVTDYALELEATFYVDKTTYGREAENINSGEMKEVVIKLGLDENSNEVDGQSVVITAPLTKTVTYKDSEDKDLLQRVVTYRLMNDTAGALTLKMGAFA